MKTLQYHRKRPESSHLIIYVHGFTGGPKTFKNRQTKKYLHEYVDQTIRSQCDFASFGYAERTLQLLNTRDPNNLSSIIAVKQLDTIRVEADAIRWRAVTIPRTVRPFTTASRNDLCPCGSGKKYKNCCGK